MEMEKAYDMQPLLDAFKARGLDCAEDAVMGAIEDIFAWLKTSAELSENPYDDLAVVLHPQAIALLKAAADKIDGKEG